MRTAIILPLLLMGTSTTFSLSGPVRVVKKNVLLLYGVTPLMLSAISSSILILKISGIGSPMETPECQLLTVYSTERSRSERL